MAINPNPALRVIQVLFVQEPASAFFSFVIAMLFYYFYTKFLQVRSRNNHRSDEERLIALMTALLYLVWLAAYAASTLFHVHETVLTERADYFLPVFATMTQLVYGIVVVSPFVRQHATLCLPIVVLPLTAFALYFMYVMLVVKFDYGWHNKIVITLLVSDVLVFVPWMIANVRRKPYVWYNVIGYLCIFGAAPLELFDFEPLLKTFDGHSLWHGGGVFASYFISKFALAAYEDLCCTNQEKLF